MTRPDLAALRRNAEAAIQAEDAVIAASGQHREDLWTASHDAQRAFHDEADPTTILALLDELEALRAQPVAWQPIESAPKAKDAPLLLTNGVSVSRRKKGMAMRDLTEDEKFSLATEALGFGVLDPSDQKLTYEIMEAAVRKFRDVNGLSESPEPAAWMCGDDPNNIISSRQYQQLLPKLKARWDVPLFASPAPAAPKEQPLNGIAATDFHGEGAIARCSYCGRYSLDRKTLGEDRYQPVCECGEKHGWSGSFKKPGPHAKWSGAAPEGVQDGDALGDGVQGKDGGKQE